jgi:hypothetical protein
MGGVGAGGVGVEWINRGLMPVILEDYRAVGFWKQSGDGTPTPGHDN